MTVSYTHLLLGTQRYLTPFTGIGYGIVGKIARQQGQGQIQLPLSDCGVVALDYRGEKLSLIHI